MRETDAQKSSGDELRTLWESGVSLDSAWIEFAKFFDRFSYTALCTHPTNDPDLRSLAEPRYIELFTGSWLPRTWEARQRKLASTAKNERIYLLGEIYAGHLWAIGFRTLPNGADEVVRVPRQLFFFDEAGEREQRPDIHWGKGELLAGSVSYFDIRIVPVPSTTDELAAPTIPADECPIDDLNPAASLTKAKRSKGPARRRGKKSRRKKFGGRPPTHLRIRREFRRLCDEKSGFRNWPTKRMVPAVRAALLGDGRKNEEASGYRSSSMAKIIGQERAALRKRSNRNKPNKPRTP